MQKIRIPFLLIAIGSLFLAVPSVVTAQISFNRQIRPLLSKHCLVCHGADEGSRAAGLRLDTFDDATGDRGGYFAVVPGDAKASELIHRISSTDDPMPPEEHGESLTSEQIDLLRRWIGEGAVYQTHWSFTKPEMPVIPEAPNDLCANPSIILYSKN